MSAPTFEELSQQFNVAIAQRDIQALNNCASALFALGTDQAQELATQALGNAAYLLGNYTEALKNFRVCLSIHEGSGNTQKVARILGSIGNVYAEVGDFRSSTEHYQRAFAYCEEPQLQSLRATLFGNIGSNLYDTGHFPEALEQFFIAQTVFVELGDTASVARITNSIANVHNSTGAYPEALMHYHNALGMYVSVGHRSGIALVTGNIGNVHSDTGNYAAALDNFLRALDLHELLGERASVARVFGNIGNMYTRTGSHSDAIAWYNKSIALFREIGASEAAIQVIGNLLEVLVQAQSFDDANELLTSLDTSAIATPSSAIVIEMVRASLLANNGRTEEAQQILQSALKKARQFSLRNQEADVHWRLRELCQLTGDFAGYIENNNLYTRINEEVNGKDTAAKLATQEKQREIDAKEKEHASYMAVLNSTLPKQIAERVARGEPVNDSFLDAAVLFLDVVGFTSHSSALSPTIVVDMLQTLFTRFDALCANHHVMKIKTIGDSYMAVAFPGEGHIRNIASLALTMLGTTIVWPGTNTNVEFRIGIHIGPVVASVLGTERLQYDVWGDTVNTASRMESSGQSGCIQVSNEFVQAARLCNSAPFHFTERGTITIQGKGAMTTYWLTSVEGND